MSSSALCEGATDSPSSREIPWQVWLVALLLAFAAVHNLTHVPSPKIFIYVAFKCGFIVGLLKGVRWVYVLLVVGYALTTIVLLILSPISTAVMTGLYLLKIGLLLSSHRFYFPSGRVESDPESIAPGS